MDTLAAEHVTFASTGLSTAETPYLGDIATDEHGMIHRLRLESLLPAPVRVRLLTESGA
jgi:hypothetical protein